MKKNDFFPGTGLFVAAVFALGLAACTSNVPAPVVDRGGAIPARALASSADSYVVKAGDTLYSIAREHGMDHRDLIALNRIENPDQIAVGQTLRIKPDAVAAPVPSDTVIVRPVGDAQVGRASGVDGGKIKREPKAGKEPYSDQALAAAQGQPKPAETPAAAAPEAPNPPPPQAAGDTVPWMWPASGKLIGTFSESGTKGIEIDGKPGDSILAAGGGRVVYSGTGLRGYGKLVIVKHNNSFLSAYAHNRNILVVEGQSVTKGQKIAEMGNTDADRVKLHFEIRYLGKPVDPLKYLPPR